MPILYQAIYHGVQQGLQISLEESKKPEQAENNNLLAEVISSVVLESLGNVIDFSDEMLELKQNIDQAEEQI